jgi:tetratricopeptide (TPR) repeat protein
LSLWFDGEILRQRRKDKIVVAELSEVASLFAEGVALHRAGRLADAEMVYRRILATQADHFESLHLLGVVFYQRGDHASAISQIDLALIKSPNNVRALNNRGAALKELNRFEEALESCDRALAIQPDHPEALYNRGVVLHELKRFEGALASYDRVLKLKPGYPEALYNRGNTLRELKRFPEALASYDRALAKRPHHVATLSNRGLTLHDLGRFDEALLSYDRALSHRPDNPKALSNRGITLQVLSRFEEALESYDRALAVRPEYPEALYNRGIVLHQLKRFEEALESYDRALAQRSHYAEALSNRGLALHEMTRFEEALASFDAALTLRPDCGEAHSHRGTTLHEMQRFDEALASYHRAINLRPDCAEAHYNLALCQLLTGDFERGWREREWRWRTEQSGRWNFKQPVWRGSNNIAGKTILLHTEQGFGDMIQFCRYVPLVAECAARVILEVPEPLHQLMGTLRGVAQVVSTGQPLPDFDMHCPLLSLPLAFDTRLDTVPSATPYLGAPSQASLDWNARLGLRNRPRIGLCWSGRSEHKNDRNRSIILDTLLPLLDFDATFVSLQQQVRSGDGVALKRRSNLLHFGHDLKNFSDTAALIANLDLVVSVDTGVAHLAGALAKPVWVMLPLIPDWRWLLDREDSPWYPTARLFRQDSTRTWDYVVSRVHAALHDWMY